MLELVDIREKESLLDSIRNTYENSFPIQERRDFSKMLDLIKSNPQFTCFAVELNSIYAGFITFWQFESFTYIEHFAVEEAMRSEGIGRRTMQKIKEMLGAIVLEVEVPIDELTKRRVKFYQRMAFTLDSQVYHQPPYRDGDIFLEMRLMSLKIDLEANYDSVCHDIYQKVYQYSGEIPSTSPIC